MIHLFSLHLLACLTAGRNNTQDMVPLNNQNQLYEDKMRDKGWYIYIYSFKGALKNKDFLSRNIKVFIQYIECKTIAINVTKKYSEDKSIGYF